MRRIALVVSVLSALIAPLAGAASDSAQPRLRVLDKAPLVLRGTGFAAAERVKVAVVTRDGEVIRRTRASRLGIFVVRFDTFVDACFGARQANAEGRRGSKASIVLERPLQRECAELGGAP
jgi:hypothetical protein